MDLYQKENHEKIPQGFLWDFLWFIKEIRNFVPPLFKVVRR